MQSYQLKKSTKEVINCPRMLVRSSFKKNIFLFLTFISILANGYAQDLSNNPGSNHGNKFEQLGMLLPDPNGTRTASGAPGAKYWQQQTDYNIKCELDVKALKLQGSETATYHNNSPDELSYLWVQLNENSRSNVNNANFQRSTTMPETIISTQAVDRATASVENNGLGINITKVTDASGKPIA